MFLHDQLYFTYYPFVIVSFIYMLNVVRLNKLGLFIVALFWGGMVSFFSELALGYGIGFDLHNIYKIVMSFWAISLFWKEVLKPNSNRDVMFNAAWVVFSLFFWGSYLYHGGGFLTIASQYLYKYGMLFLIYYGMKHIFRHNKWLYVRNLLLKIMFVQVVLSIIKIIISLSMMQTIPEYIVGSVSLKGAGLAVALPFSGLFLYWQYRDKKIMGKDIIIALSFLLIAVASSKRSPVFLFPIVFLGLSAYATNVIKISSLFKYIPLVFVLFYFGVRTNWTLNPEKSRWGSFDIEYVYRYAMRYNFGVSDVSEITQEGYQSTGRGAGATLIFKPKQLGVNSTIDYLFGKGLYDVATQQHGKVKYAEARQAYGFDHEGLMGSTSMLVLTFGYFGFLSLVSMSLLVLSSIKDRKMKNVLILFYLWELFFYGNQFMGQHESMFIVAFVAHFEKYSYKIKCFDIKNAETDIAPLTRRVENILSKRSNPLQVCKHKR